MAGFNKKKNTKKCEEEKTETHPSTCILPGCAVLPLNDQLGHKWTDKSGQLNGWKVSHNMRASVLSMGY